MSRGQRIALWVLAAVLVAFGLTYIFKGKEIRRLMAVNVLFEQENIVYNFSHMPELFFHEELPRGNGAISPLVADPQPLPDLTQWIEDRQLTGLVILHDGKLVHEDYFLGTAPEDKRISWSVAKSYLSALTGIMLDEGVIESIDDPVTKYAPSLIGSAYDGATLKNVLQMSSGIQFDEDYLDPKSDINRMGRALALGNSMNRFAEQLRVKERAPGTQWQYVSIDTHVIGMVIEGAAKKRIADLMSERIIQPLGVEAAPVYLTDKGGTAFVLGGLNMPTRDYARFGQLYLQQGNYNGQQIVPANWITASTRPSANTQEGAERYGYQWWIHADAPDGEYYARGIYGQYIYIHEGAQVVIAMNSADRRFREPNSNDQNVEMFRAIVAALHQESEVVADETEQAGDDGEAGVPSDGELDPSGEAAE